MRLILRCRFQKSTPKTKQRVYARACFDTGAQISAIPRSLLNQVQNWQKIKCPCDVTFIAANGTPMGVGEFTKFKLVIEASGFTLTLGPVLITDDDGIGGLTILICTTDLKRNRINIEIVTDEIVFPDNTRLSFESSISHTKTGRIAVVRKEAQPEVIQQSARESAKATNPRMMDQTPDSLVEIVFPDNTGLPLDSSVPHSKTGRMAAVRKQTQPEAIQRSARESAKATNPREKDQRSDSLVDSRAPVSYVAAVKSDPQPNVDRSQLDECDEYRGRMENQAEKLKTYTKDQVNRQPDLLLSDLDLTKELITTMWECRRVFSATISRATNRCAAKVTSEESEWSIHVQFGGLISNHFLRTAARAVMRPTIENWSDEIKQRVGQTKKSFQLAEFRSLRSNVSNTMIQKTSRLKNQNITGVVVSTLNFENKRWKATVPMRTLESARGRNQTLSSTDVRFGNLRSSFKSSTKTMKTSLGVQFAGLTTRKHATQSKETRQRPENQNLTNLWICGYEPNRSIHTVPKVSRNRNSRNGTSAEFKSSTKTMKTRLEVQFGGLRTTKLNKPVRKTKVQRPKNQNERMDQEPGVKWRNRPQALQLQDSIQFGGLISKLSSQNVSRKVMGLKNQQNRMNEELNERRSKLNRLHFSRTPKSPTRTAGTNELKVSKKFRKGTKSFPIVQSMSLITTKLSTTNRGTKVMELAKENKARTQKEECSRLKHHRSKTAERSQPTWLQTASNQLAKLDLGTQNRAVGCQTKSPRKGSNNKCPDARPKRPFRVGTRTNGVDYTSAERRRVIESVHLESNLEETPGNLQVSPAAESTEIDPRIDILRKQLKAKVTMTRPETAERSQPKPARLPNRRDRDLEARSGNQSETVYQTVAIVGSYEPYRWSLVCFPTWASENSSYNSTKSYVFWASVMPRLEVPVDDLERSLLVCFTLDSPESSHLGRSAPIRNLEDSEPTYSLDLTPVPATELSEITQSLRAQDPKPSPPVHTPETPAAWENASLASTIPLLEAGELTKVYDWSHIQEETPDNLQVTPTPGTTETEPQMDILARQLGSVVTMTPRNPQRLQSMALPESSKKAKEVRLKRPQTAKRSLRPPARRSTRSREQPDPESCSKRSNIRLQKLDTVNDTEPGHDPDLKPSEESHLAAFEEMSQSDSPEDDLEMTGTLYHPVQPQTAKRSPPRPPARRSTRTREQPDPKSCSKRPNIL